MAQTVDFHVPKAWSNFSKDMARLRYGNPIIPLQQKNTSFEVCDGFIKRADCAPCANEKYAWYSLLATRSGEEFDDRFLTAANGVTRGDIIDLAKAAGFDLAKACNDIGVKFVMAGPGGGEYQRRLVSGCTLQEAATFFDALIAKTELDRIVAGLPEGVAAPREIPAAPEGEMYASERALLDKLIEMNPKSSIRTDLLPKPTRHALHDVRGVVDLKAERKAELSAEIEYLTEAQQQFKDLQKVRKLNNTERRRLESLTEELNSCKEELKTLNGSRWW